MANADAWTAGWDKGTQVSKKKSGKDDGGDDKGKKKPSPAGGGGGGGGGNPWSILSYLPKLHSGGRVKKTGAYRLRKNEVVLTSAQQNKYGIKKGKVNKSSSRKHVVKK